MKLETAYRKLAEHSTAWTLEAWSYFHNTMIVVVATRKPTLVGVGGPQVIRVVKNSKHDAMIAIARKLAEADKLAAEVG